MRFYQILTPRNNDFAHFGIHGTWEPKKIQGVCPECKMTRQKRVPPLIIEWEPGSDLVGDFVWRGVSFELVCKEEIAKELIHYFNGFQIFPIEMIQDTNIKIPKNPKKPKKKRIYLPYEGPKLSELWVDCWKPLDEAKSELNLEKVCSTCGYRFYTPKRTGLVLDESKNTMYDFFLISRRSYYGIFHTMHLDSPLRISLPLPFKMLSLCPTFQSNYPSSQL